MSSQTEYKHTLNLPKTEFPMRGNLAKREPEMLDKWREQNLYARIREARKDAPKFVLHDGPPYTSGHIHYGHILNKVLKDLVVKFHTMKGESSPYIPGWDCHGLPIELQVERKLGDIVFVGYHDGIVELYMQGACSGCPSSTATLKLGIEARLREEIPEVQEVVAL